MSDPDVLVVGAGPAGCAAALVLARAGARVRLLDRSRFPRDKLCGDTLNPGALSLLERLGVHSVRPQALPITGMTVTGPGGTSVTADYPDGLRGAAITRRDLDTRLVEAAGAAGCSVEAGHFARTPLLASGTKERVTGVRVVTPAGERDLHARVVIAAEGRCSRLAFSLGLARYATTKRWAFGAYFEGIDGMTSRGEMHIRPDGYLGIAPLGGGIANVCVVRTLGRGFRSPRASSDDCIRAAVEADRVLNGRFARARRVSKVTCLGPLAIESPVPGCRGLLLAGDSAGFIDPMTGDGLRFALRGGELAAQAALRELDTGAPSVSSLARQRAREFSGKWRVNRVLRWLAGSPRGLDVAACVAERWKTPIEYLIGVAGDVHLARSLAPVISRTR